MQRSHRGKRGCADSKVGGEGDTEAGPQGSVGSRCVEMEGEGFPSKVLSGVMTIGHRSVGLQDSEKKQRPAEEATVSCRVQGGSMRRGFPQE